MGPSGVPESAAVSSRALVRRKTPPRNQTVSPALGILAARLSSRTASRARSSVAKGFDLKPELASDPLVDTNKSALTAKQNNSQPVVEEASERVIIGGNLKAWRARVSW